MNYPSERLACAQRTLASAIATAILVNVCLGPVAEASVWQDRGRGRAGRSVTALASLPRASASAFHAPIAPPPLNRVPASGRGLSAAWPRTAGSIRRAASPAVPSNKTVFLVQDVHSNREAQSAIAAGVASLGIAGAGVVALEGTSEALDHRRFRGFPGAQSVRRAASYLLNQSLISGAAFASYVGGANFPDVVGAEDAALYAANVRAFLDSRSNQAEVTSALARRDLELNRRWSAASGRLASLNASARSYASGGGLGAYLRVLVDTGAAAMPISRRFLSALELETNLDFAAADRERANFLEQLAGRAAPASAARLIQAAAEHRSGRLSQTAFHDQMANAADEAGLRLSVFPNLKRYVDYLRLSEEIDGEALFEELYSAESAAFRKLASTAAERRLVDDTLEQRFNAKLAAFALTDHEWDRAPRIIDPLLRSHADFYRYAVRRNEALAASVLREMEKRGAATGVLVAGGFHSRGIEAHLTRVGVSVMTVVPTFTAALAPGPAAHLSAFAQEKTPLEKLFSGERLFLAKPPDVAPALTGLIAALDHPGDFRLSVAELAPELAASVSERDESAERASTEVNGNTVTVVRSPDAVTAVEVKPAGSSMKAVFALFVAFMVLAVPATVATDDIVKSYPALLLPVAIVLDMLAAFFGSVAEQVWTHRDGRNRGWTESIRHHFGAAAKDYDWRGIRGRAWLGLFWGAVIFLTLGWFPAELAAHLHWPEVWLAALQTAVISFILSPFLINPTAYLFGRGVVGGASLKTAANEATTGMLAFSRAEVFFWTGASFALLLMQYAGFGVWTVLGFAAASFFWEIIEFRFLAGRSQAAKSTERSRLSPLRFTGLPWLARAADRSLTAAMIAFYARPWFPSSMVGGLVLIAGLVAARYVDLFLPVFTPVAVGAALALAAATGFAAESARRLADERTRRDWMKTWFPLLVSGVLIKGGAAVAIIVVLGVTPVASPVTLGFLAAVIVLWMSFPAASTKKRKKLATGALSALILAGAAVLFWSGALPATGGALAITTAGTLVLPHYLVRFDSPVTRFFRRSAGVVERAFGAALSFTGSKINLLLDMAFDLPRVRVGSEIPIGDALNVYPERSAQRRFTNGGGRVIRFWSPVHVAHMVRSKSLQRRLDNEVFRDQSKRLLRIYFNDIALFARAVAAGDSRFGGIDEFAFKTHLHDPSVVPGIAAALEERGFRFEPTPGRILRFFDWLGTWLWFLEIGRGASRIGVTRTLWVHRSQMAALAEVFERFRDEADERLALATRRGDAPLRFVLESSVSTHLIDEWNGRRREIPSAVWLNNADVAVGPASGPVARALTGFTGSVSNFVSSLEPEVGWVLSVQSGEFTRRFHWDGRRWLRESNGVRRLIRRLNARPAAPASAAVTHGVFPLALLGETGGNATTTLLALAAIGMVLSAVEGDNDGFADRDETPGTPELDQLTETGASVADEAAREPSLRPAPEVGGALHRGSLVDLIAMALASTMKAEGRVIKTLKASLNGRGAIDTWAEGVYAEMRTAKKDGGSRTNAEARARALISERPDLPLGEILAALLASGVLKPVGKESRRHVAPDVKRLQRRFEKALAADESIGLRSVKVRVHEGKGLIRGPDRFILAPFLLQGDIATFSIHRLVLEALLGVPPRSFDRYANAIVARELRSYAEPFESKFPDENFFDERTAGRSTEEEHLFHFLRMLLNTRVGERHLAHLPEISHDLKNPVAAAATAAQTLPDLLADLRAPKVTINRSKLLDRLFERISAAASNLDDVPKKKRMELTRSHPEFYSWLGRTADATVRLNEQLGNPQIPLLTAQIREWIEGIPPTEDAKQIETANFAKRMLTTIDENGAFARRIVSSVDKFLQEGRYRIRQHPVDMVSVINDVRRRFDAGEITIQLHRPEGNQPAVIYGDADHLVRLFDNLFRNARRVAERIDVYVETPGREVIVRIQDDGPGFKKELLSDDPDEVDPAWRKGVSGAGSSGVGLSISREIVNAHDGQAYIDQIPGAGGMFVLRFPQDVSAPLSQLRVTPDEAREVLERAGGRFVWNFRRGWDGPIVEADRNAAGLRPFMEAWLRLSQKFPLREAEGENKDGWRSIKYHSFSYDRSHRLVDGPGDVIRHLVTLFQDPSLGMARTEVERLGAEVEAASHPDARKVADRRAHSVIAALVFAERVRAELEKRAAGSQPGALRIWAAVSSRLNPAADARALWRIGFIEGGLTSALAAAAMAIWPLAHGAGILGLAGFLPIFAFAFFAGAVALHYGVGVFTASGTTVGPRSGHSSAARLRAAVSAAWSALSGLAGVPLVALAFVIPGLEPIAIIALLIAGATAGGVSHAAMNEKIRSTLSNEREVAASVASALSSGSVPLHDALVKALKGNPPASLEIESIDGRPTRTGRMSMGVILAQEEFRRRAQDAGNKVERPADAFVENDRAAIIHVHDEGDVSKIDDAAQETVVILHPSLGPAEMRRAARAVDRAGAAVIHLDELQSAGGLYSYDEVVQLTARRRPDWGLFTALAANRAQGRLVVISDRAEPFTATSDLASAIVLFIESANGWAIVPLGAVLRAARAAAISA